MQPTYMKFQRYIPKTGFVPESDDAVFIRSEGETDYDVIKRLGYSERNVIFSSGICEIKVYESSDCSDNSSFHRFLFEIEICEKTDYVFVSGISEFLEFVREYIPALDVLNRNMDSL